MSNKWIGGLKYTYLGNLKAMETKDGFKPVVEMMHDLWRELHDLRQQSAADKFMFTAIGNDLEDRRNEIEVLKAEVHRLKVRLACAISEAPGTPKGFSVSVTALTEERLFHRGGIVGDGPVPLVGEHPFGTLVAPFEIAGGQIADTTVDLLSIAPDLKKT